ncbi:MAG: glycoside hydrolase, partial [Actinomycetota bacterium]|nr:glycoside hydrolase [Actinomycetota bacterium]
ALLCAGAPAWGASPAAGTITPDASGQGSVAWTGTARPGTETLGEDQGAGCFGPDNRPNPTSGCDVFALDVAVPESFYRDHPGAVNVTVGGFGLSDLDLYIYRRNADGSRGDFVNGAGELLGIPENAAIDRAAGLYYVVVTPYTTIGVQSYTAAARLAIRQGPSLAELEKAAPAGVTNHRASHDRYTSHSETTIAMDPLNHDHLIAGSKMFENNEKYLFKIGTYESANGGRTWQDQGHLPGYCAAPGQCDPSNEAGYRTTSDPSIAFDDEGSAYANVLDAPGGTFAFQGFNMTVHRKSPGEPWTDPTTVHNNRNNPITARLLLDDKNWIAVDNVTDVNGGPNRPRDGKIGTMYVCWSLDAFPVVQQIVVMRSLDGGRTWGGLRPRDNLPYPLSQKTLISGIGCHLAIGPKGEVYATWYDNQLNALMQSKTTNRGRTWSLAVPIAGIRGIQSAFTGEAFRNISLPTTGVDRKGNVYVAVSSRNAEGRPLLGNLLAVGRKIKSGELGLDAVKGLIGGGEEEESPVEHLAGGDGNGPESGSDIVLFKSTNGGRSYTGPVRVNQDPANADADQFQPAMSVTESGRIDISFFDRRNDPANYFIDTYLAQSDDGGRTFTDRRVSQRMWDAAVAAPTSVSGKFIGDYQGLVSDDKVAIPFWNDTQLANLPASDPRHSPYQEVFSARVPDDPGAGTGGRCFARRAKVGRRSIGRLVLGQTRARVRSRLGRPGRRKKGMYRYCVRGGGSVVALFTSKGRVAVAASTARGHRRLGVGR